MPPEDTNIIAFRLTALEEMVMKSHDDLLKSHVSLLERLDLLLEKQQARDVVTALEAQKGEQLRVDVDKIEKRQDLTDKTLLKLQISMAEKLGPGALAGGAVAVFIELARFLVIGA